MAGPCRASGDTGAAWRLGEELWRGPFRRASTGTVPWQGRQGYGPACLGPAGPALSPTLLVLGGLHEDAGPLNDVWRSDDEGQSWECVSPHDAGRRDGGNLILKKWIGRSAFAIAASWSFRGGRLTALVYVVGGNGPRRQLADVWVSQDLGRTWVRMCSQAPFGARSSPSLAVCPGSPHRLLLSGGITGTDMYKAGSAARVLDCWVSGDAGETWAAVGAPGVPPRFAPKLHFASQESIILLGGSRLSIVGQAVERSVCSDAFIADIDWEEQHLQWRPAQIFDAVDGRKLVDLPLHAEFVTGGLRSADFVALDLPAHPTKTIAGASRRPGSDLAAGGTGAEEAAKAAVAAGQVTDNLRCSLVEPAASPIERPEHLLLPAGGLSLVLLTGHGAWTTRVVRSSAGNAVAEPRMGLGPAAGLRRQLSFTNWLGSKLEAGGLPFEVWSRVIAHVFHPRALALPGLPSHTFQWRKAAEQALKQLGDTVRICILGPTDAVPAAMRELVEATAVHLDSSVSSEVSFITMGMAGAQRIFASSCSDASRVFNLLPVGQGSDYESGTDIHAGSNRSQCLEVFHQIGDVFVVFEGGPEVVEEARVVSGREALVVLLAGGCTRSATAPFPNRALQRPDFLAEEKWALLQDPEALFPDRADAVVAAVTAFALSKERPEQAVVRLARVLRDKVRVCLLVGALPAGRLPEVEEAAWFTSLVRAMAWNFDACLDPQTCFIIAGTSEDHRAFAENCGDGSQVYHLLPLGQSSGCNPHLDLHAGANHTQCREVFARLGDIYVVVGSVPEVAWQARRAVTRGARVVPVMNSSLQKPAFVPKELWECLQSRDAPTPDVASAASTVVMGLVAELNERRTRLLEAEREAMEDAERRAKEDAERRLREEADHRARLEQERRAREEEAAINLQVIHARGIPIVTVRMMPDDRVGKLRQLVSKRRLDLNSHRFLFRWDTTILTDDMTLLNAGLRNGSMVTVVEY